MASNASWNASGFQARRMPLVPTAGAKQNSENAQQHTVLLHGIEFANNSTQYFSTGYIIQTTDIPD
jgi:hypothetical protein